ncbi:MAG TPA: hypothetical protein VLB82_02900, partial [Thermodesulfobacteriota bacterium]|nr:hypothetical protein [Thermodesulfobacteriota bacterium]
MSKRKPAGYWTKERCKKAALECKHKGEFSKTYSSAYGSALRNGWMNDICSHMKEAIKPKGYWTKERCKEAALRCEIKKVFKKKYRGAYEVSLKNDWLDEVIKPSIFWTKDKCRKTAILCKLRSEFNKKYPGAYNASRKNKWLDEVCSHMNTKKRKQLGYWTKEKCKKAALECKHKGEFNNTYPRAYTISRKNKWLDELCIHMNRPKSKIIWTKERCYKLALLCKTRTEFQKEYPGAYN